MRKNLVSLKPGTGPAAIALAAALIAPLPALAADSPQDFYKGRAMKIVIGFDAGGGYDSYARIAGRHLANHIPGRPNIVPQNMPGAGSRRAASFVANIAPRDGSVIGAIDQSLPLRQAMGEKGFDLDMRELLWIGNLVTGTNVVLVWHTAGVRTIEEARAREITIGATGSSSNWYPRAMNALVGTKFRIILGYQGGSQINLAMERGEVAGRTNTWASLKALNGDWLRDRKINVIAQIGLAREKELPDVPLLMDLARNPQDRQLLKLLSTPAAMGRPVVSTPAVPADRARALRAAFDAMVTDKGFLAEAARLNLEINAMNGAEMEAIVTDAVSTPAAEVKRLADLIGFGEKKSKKK